MRWLEIYLVTSGELAEAVADLFARHAPGAVAVSIEGSDPWHPENAHRVSVFLDEDETLEEKRRAIDEGLWHLSQIAALPAAQTRLVENENWSESWKVNYRPTEIGARLLILPAWIPAPPGPRIPILIEPGMAFGTGTHPTTRLALELLERHIEPGDLVADVGCGSGILGIAALRLGARRVLAVDIEDESVPNTLENAALNQVSDLLEVRLGSLDDLRAMIAAQAGLPRLIVANILAHVLLELLEEGMADLLLPGGVLILSGVLDGKQDALLARCAALGLQRMEQRSQADWFSYSFRSAG